MSMQQKVKEFHEAYGVPVADKPGFPTMEIRQLRTRLLAEEVNEYVEGEKRDDLENVAKELADVLYITFGTAVSYGIPLEAVFDAVHASNMSKLGIDGQPIRREDGKVLKGPNYKEPNIKKVLYE